MLACALGCTNSLHVLGTRRSCPEMVSNCAQAHDCKMIICRVLSYFVYRNASSVEDKGLVAARDPPVWLCTYYFSRQVTPLSALSLAGDASCWQRRRFAGTAGPFRVTGLVYLA